MDDLLSIAETNQEKARQVITASGIVPAWQSVGADIRLVGSLRMGLLLHRRNIDFHAYTPFLNLASGFQAMAKLAAQPAVRRIACTNHLNDERDSIDWRILYCDAEGNEWQIDLIHRRRGSRWDGYFERRAQRIAAVLTAETKAAILALKHAAPKNEPEHIHGIEYCYAVLHCDLRTWDEFVAWRRQHPLQGVLEWCP